MNHANPCDLEVIRRPEGDDEENTDEEEGPGRVVFLFFGHGLVRRRRSSPDVDVRRGELRYIHSSGASSAAADVGRLRKASMTKRRRQGGKLMIV